jgi:hypothetical protein
MCANCAEGGGELGGGGRPAGGQAGGRIRAMPYQYRSGHKPHIASFLVDLPHFGFSCVYLKGPSGQIRSVRKWHHWI